MPRIAHLVAAYAVHDGMPAMPSIEDALMIEPPTEPGPGARDDRDLAVEAGAHLG
jgi:hypothetical protein